MWDELDRWWLGDWKSRQHPYEQVDVETPSDLEKELGFRVVMMLRYSRIGW